MKKHLTLILAMVLCTAVTQPLFAQINWNIQVTVQYDSISVDSPLYFPNHQPQATASFVSNGSYFGTFHLIWADNPEDAHNGVGYEIGPPVVFIPGVTEHTAQFTLYPSVYLSMTEYLGPREGIYFNIHSDGIFDADSNLVQVYSSPTYTWRFPSEDISTSVEENESAGYNMYPNPTTDSFQVKGYSGLVQITDVLGRSVLSTQAKNGQSIDISNLPIGMYTVNTADRTFTGRLQKL